MSRTGVRDFSAPGLLEPPPEEEEEPKGGGSGGDDDSEGGDDESKGGSSPSPAPGMSKSEINEFAKEMMENAFGEDESNESDSEQMAAFNDFVDDMTDEPTSSKANIDYSNEGIATDGNVKFIKSTSNKSTYQTIQ